MNCKALYRSHKEMVFDDYYTTEVGKAKLVEEGNDITIVSYGMGVHWSKDAMKNISNYSADIIDLRTLQPWDKEAVRKSVEKTNKIIIVHEDSITGGIGAEISAWVTENCFSYLDGPVMRVGGLDTPIPFRKELEENFMPTDRIEEKINSLNINNSFFYGKSNSSNYIFHIKKIIYFRLLIIINCTIKMKKQQFNLTVLFFF